LNIFKYKLRYSGKENFIGYTDSDFIGDLEDRKSTSGHIILMENSPICWGSKMHTTEAEHIATSEYVKKVLWIRNILQELINFKQQITIFTDNISSLKIIKKRWIEQQIKTYFNKILF